MMLSNLNCPVCGAANEPTYSHCYSCGHALSLDRAALPRQIPLQNFPQFPPQPEGTSVPKLVARKKMSRRRLFTLLGVGAGMLAAGILDLSMPKGLAPQLTDFFSENLFADIRFKSPIHNIAWLYNDQDSSSEFLVSGCADGTVSLVDMGYDPDVYGQYPPISYAYTAHDGAVTSITTSSDNQYLATSSTDGTVKVIKILFRHNTEGATYNKFAIAGRYDIVTYKGHKGAVHALAWSPDNKRLASASSDGTVQIWDAQTGKTILTHRQQGAIYALVWSPDGEVIVSGGTQKTLDVWQSRSGNLIFTYQGHTDTITALAWSKEGEHIASASADATVHVWNAIYGYPISTYTSHTGAVRDMDWFDEYIASASADGTVQVWRATDAAHIYTYRDHSAAVNAVMWAGWALLCSGSDDKSIRIWHALGI